MAAANDHRWVVAFAGARDSYQVPIALHEAGLLQTLVTDFYLHWIEAFSRASADFGHPRFMQKSPDAFTLGYCLNSWSLTSTMHSRISGILKAG